METPNQIQLTEKDKERYRKEIEAIDINIENSVMQLIPEKLEVLINLPQLDDANCNWLMM